MGAFPWTSWLLWNSRYISSCGLHLIYTCTFHSLPGTREEEWKLVNLEIGRVKVKFSSIIKNSFCFIYDNLKFVMTHTDLSPYFDFLNIILSVLTMLGFINWVSCNMVLVITLLHCVQYLLFQIKLVTFTFPCHLVTPFWYYSCGLLHSFFFFFASVF